jgi:aspartate kinase
MMKTVIHKFGGGIIGNGNGIVDIDRITKSYEAPQLIVPSAPKGVTDRLKYCLSNPEDISSVLGYCFQIGEKFIGSNTYRGLFNGRLREIEKQARDLVMNPDEMLGLGEEISTDFIYFHKKSNGEGIGRVNFDRMSTEKFPIVCTDKQENANILLEESKSRIGIVREQLEKYGQCVTPGFIGVTKEGKLRTLGRGGSDYTAIYYGHALGSGEANLWKDTKGVLAADPRIVDEPRTIDFASYSEINNMAKFGAKIVHHKSSRLAEKTRTAIRIPYIKDKEIFTLVNGGKKKEDHLVKYVGAVNNATLMHCPFERMVKIRDEFKRENSDHDFLINWGESDMVDLILLNGNNGFQNEGEKVGLVATVGDGLKNTKNVLKRATSIISEDDINIKTYGGGASNSYMCFVVDPRHTNTVTNLLYENLIRNATNLD